MNLPEDFTPTLNATDWVQLGSFQLARYAEQFPALLGSCSVLPSYLDCSVTIVAYDAESLAALRAKSVELRFEAYAILGAETLAISYESVIVYRSQTLPSQSWEAVKESSARLKDHTKLGGNLNNKKLPTMTSTTVAPVAPSSATNAEITSVFPTFPKASLNMPVMENLNAITARAGIDVEYAAAKLLELNQFVAWNPAGYYQTTFEAWGIFSDNYAANLKSLLGVPSSQNLMPTVQPPVVEPTEMPDAGAATNGAKPAKVKTTTRKPAAAKTPRQARTTASTRFKSFMVSNKTAITIGNFLDAQKYSDEERIDIVEKLASAPETSDPTMQDSLAERIIDRIMKACKAANKRVSRTGIIKAAGEMRGVPPNS